MEVSLQLYTVRKQAQHDLTKIAQKISAIGYRGIEAARIDFCDKSARELCEIRKETGLRITSTQIKYHQLESDFENCVSWLKKTQCKIAVVACMPYKIIGTGSEKLISFFEKVNALGQKYKNEGITLAYHHHSFEFLQCGAQKACDIMMSTLDFGIVSLVCDTYWLQRSGVCPQSFIREHADKIIGVHLRDCAVANFGAFTYARDCAVGQGYLQIGEIIESCKTAQVAYIAIEQNSTRPLEDAKQSLEYLKKGGLIDA